MSAPESVSPQPALPSVPASAEMEEAVLGSCLMDPDAVHKLAATLELESEDFYYERNSRIYQAMLDLTKRGEPVDILLLANHLEAKGQLANVGGEVYLLSLVSSTPTGVYADYYAGIVKDLSLRRQALDRVAKGIQAIYNPQGFSASQAVAALQNELRQLKALDRPNTLKTMRQVMDEAVAQAEQAQARGGKLLGLPTGCRLLDFWMGGWVKGRSYYVAGRPSVGKTTWLLASAIQASRYVEGGYPVLIFSLEQASSDLGHKMLAQASSLSTRDISEGRLRDDDWPVLLESADGLAGLNVLIDDAPDWTEATLAARCEQVALEYGGLGMVVIDYLQRMSGSAKRYESRTRELSAISKALAGLARNLQTPVVTVTALSRAANMRVDSEPEIDDVGESDKPSYDADGIILLWREVTQGKDIKDGVDESRIIKGKLGKNRFGPTGLFEQYFDLEKGRFYEIEDVSLEEVAEAMALRQLPADVPLPQDATRGSRDAKAGRQWAAGNGESEAT